MDPPQAATIRRRGRPRKHALEPAAIASYLVTLPQCQHDLRGVIAHFNGVMLPSLTRLGQNPTHHAWSRAVDVARALIERQTGATFRARRMGRQVRYFLAHGGDS